MSHHRVDLFEPDLASDSEAIQLRHDAVILAELRAVLSAHPYGLRRWSVMQAIRKDRDRTGQDIHQNFEAEVERTFRRFCANENTKLSDGGLKDALFFRPSERAGEVWAILPDRASSLRNKEALVEMI
jgi:hypothetical protein